MPPPVNITVHHQQNSAVLLLQSPQVYPTDDHMATTTLPQEPFSITQEHLGHKPQMYWTNIHWLDGKWSGGVGHDDTTIAWCVLTMFSA